MNPLVDSILHVRFITPYRGFGYRVPGLHRRRPARPEVRRYRGGSGFASCGVRLERCRRPRGVFLDRPEVAAVGRVDLRSDNTNRSVPIGGSLVGL
jgi:hypothetical protein